MLIDPKIGIIGGTGRMGSWFADMIKRRGLEVICSGKNTEKAPRDLALECHIVVISVPIPDTIDVIRETGPLIKEDGIMMDLTSVKGAPVEAMLRYSRAQVVGLHPLFGPEFVDQDNLNIAVCPGRGTDGLNWISGILREEGYNITIVEPEKHDSMMGLIQGLVHYVNIALALSISRSGYGRGDLAGLSTQTMSGTMDRIRRMMEQPSELFGSLLMENQANERFIDIFRNSMTELDLITRKKDIDAFGHLFKELQSFLEDDIKQNLSGR